MATNNSEEINFQHYVDAVKQKRMDWNIFIDLMQDLSYSDKGRLRNFNAILLNELTIDFSDMDKLKYLNVILLTEFKKDIQKEHNFEMTQEEDFEKSVESNGDELLNEETTKEMPTENEILIPILNQIGDHLSYNADMNACNPSEKNTKTFLCYICNKEYNIYFHMKQHIRKVHEEKKSHKTIQRFDEHEITAMKDHKSIPNANKLKADVHEGHNDHKCKSCGKSFSQAENLKKHIYTIHEGRKDYKYES